MKKVAFIFILASSYQMAHGGQEGFLKAHVPQTRLVRNDQGQLIRIAVVDGIGNPVYMIPAHAQGPIAPGQNAPLDQDANNLGGLLCIIQ